MAGLQIKFLDIFGDYYHLAPTSGGGGGSGQLMAISSLLDFNKNFKVPTGKEDAVKDLFTKDFGVPYIYGPSLAMQEKQCKPANYADVADLLKNRIATLDDQIKQTKSLGNTGSIYVRRLEKIKKSIEGYVAEMDANKGALPICDDYKVSPLADGSEEMLNYLTRALYYGLKPAAATDEIRRCVNLFKDPKSIDAELTALLEIVKQKKKDELLSFLKQISVSVAALSDKIKADRAAGVASGAAASGAAASGAAASSAAASGAAASGAAASGAVPGPGPGPTTTFDEKAFRAALIDFFDKMSKSDLGTKSFTGAGDLFTEYTNAVTGLKIDQIGHVGVDVTGLKKFIGDMLTAAQGEPVKDDAKIDLLTDILKVIDGTATVTDITAAASKIEAFDVLKEFNILGLVRAYMAILDTYSGVGPEDIISNDLKTFEKLFSVFQEVKLINDNSPITKEQLGYVENNMDIHLNSTLNLNGKVYTILAIAYFESEFIKYGNFILGSNTTPREIILKPLHEQIKPEDIVAPQPSPMAPIDFGAFYDKYENFQIGGKIQFDGITYIIRNKVIDTMDTLTLTCRDDNGVYRIIKNPPADTVVTPSTNPSEGREPGVAGLTGASGAVGDIKKHPMMIFAVKKMVEAKKKLQAAEAELAALKGGASTTGTTNAARIAELEEQVESLTIQRNTRPKTADLMILRAELAALKAAGATGPGPVGAGGADPAVLAAAQTRVAQLEGELAAAQAVVAAGITGDDVTVLRERLTQLKAELVTLKTAADIGPAAGAAPTGQNAQQVGDITRELGEVRAAINTLKATAATRQTELQARVDGLQAALDAAAAGGGGDPALLARVAQTSSDLSTARAELARVTVATDAEKATLEQRVAELEAAVAAAGGTAATRIAELEGRIATLEADLAARPAAANVDTLRAQLATLQGELDTARAAGAGAPAGAATNAPNGARITELEEQIVTLQGRLDSKANSNRTRAVLTDRMIERHQQIVTDFQTTIDERAAALETAIRERDTAQTATHDAEERVRVAEARIAELEAEVERLTEIMLRELEVAMTRGELIETHDEELATLAAKVARLKEGRRSDRRTINIQVENLVILTTQLAERDAEITSLTARRDEIEAELGRVQTESSEHDMRANTLQEQKTALDAQIVTITAEREAASARVAEVVAQLAESQAALTRSQDELTTTLEQLATTRTALDTSTAAAATAGASRAHDALQISQLKRRITLAVGEYTTLNGEYTRASQEAATLRGQVAVHQRDVARQEAELTALQAQVTELSAQLEASEADKETLRATKAQLQESTETLRGEVARLTAQIEAATNLSVREIEALRAELAGKEREVTFKDANIIAIEVQLKDRAGVTAHNQALIKELNEEKQEHLAAVQRTREVEAELAGVRAEKAAVDIQNEEMRRLGQHVLDQLRETEAVAGVAARAAGANKTELEGRIANLEGRLRTIDEDKAALLRSGKDLTQRIAETENRYAAAALRESNLNDMIRAKEAQIAALREVERELSGRMTPLSSLQDQLDAALLRAHTSEGERSHDIVALEQQSAAARSCAAEKNTLVAQLQTFAAERAQLQARIEELGAEQTESLKNKDILEQLKQITVGLRGAGAGAGQVAKEEIASQIARYTQEQQLISTQLRTEIERLETQVTEKSSESETKTARVTALEEEIEGLRKQKSIQNFGMLTSFMTSNPAFRGAALLSMATVPEGKRSVLNTNANNIQRMIPGLEGAPDGAVYKAYMDAMTDLEKVLLPEGGANGSAVVDADVDIVTLANLVKILSSPQVSGLYTLQDLRVSPGLLATLTSEGALDDISVDEPSLSFIPPALRKTIEDRKFKITGAKVGMDFEWKSGLVGSFFNKQQNKTTDLIALFPKVNAGMTAKPVVISDTAAKPEYLNKVSLSLFEVKGNEVVAARYAESASRVREDKATHVTLADLRGIQVSEPPIFGEVPLIPRSAVTRLYLRSLKAALQSKWEATATNE
jgi:chromosome segregation ATPase